uniref:NADP-dependent oxidoreductase domain-containing protein n=1 Tax=Moniliophthora roreri TaxID=221103 RepID=A0A0W0EYT2_MONRR
MDDVLISQLPASILRSSLRAMISQGLTAQATFVEHVRGRLRETPPPYIPADELFSGDSPRHNEFLVLTRCLFSSKLASESLPYFTHFLRSIPQVHARWIPDDPLESSLQTACGDIVQAVQALKESRPVLADEHQAALFQLYSALEECETYCGSNDLSFPFHRARRQVEDLLSLKFPDLFPRPTSGARKNGMEITVTIDPGHLKTVDYTDLGSVRVPRLISGLWQLSSPAWGSASSEKQFAALTRLVEAGLVAADMADHYGDAELIFGSFRNSLPVEARESLVVATKWCVFRPLGKTVTAEFVRDAVMERSRRTGGRIELLQFHWYNYADKDYLKILFELVKLTETHPHIVTEIGLCNFDSKHTEEACTYLLSKLGRVGIVSNQIQFSLVDSRPSVQMAAVCQKYGVKLLTYGSFCGGFLSDRWLGKNAPDIYFETPQLTPSQRKASLSVTYFDMILTWGTWEDFQALLRTLKRIADKHGVELSNVATRWVLDQPQVSAVIVGTRLGVSSNVDSNLNVFSFQLDAEDLRQLEMHDLRKRTSAVFEKIGDCGHEYQK